MTSKTINRGIVKAVFHPSEPQLFNKQDLEIKFVMN